jgi:transcriptional regulator with XRE-family HTH domain
MAQRVLRRFQVERLRELREATGITMSDLARLSELSPSTISSWDHGNAAPDIARLVTVSRALGVVVSELVDVDEDARMPSDLRIRKGLRCRLGYGLADCRKCGVEVR